MILYDIISSFHPSTVQYSLVLSGIHLENHPLQLASSSLVQQSQKLFSSPSKLSNTCPVVLEVSGNSVFCLTEGLVSLSIVLLHCPSLH
jgi:hypothetical protein